MSADVEVIVIVEWPAPTDAWRCITGNALYDPCFAPSRVVHYVLCPEDGPSSGRVIRVDVTREVSPERETTEPPPMTEPAWAIELPDHAWCLLNTGTGNLVADLRENYECADGSRLFGHASRSTQPWTIFGRHGATGPLTPQPIAAIWFWRRGGTLTCRRA